MNQSFPIFSAATLALTLSLAVPAPASAAARIPMAFLGDWDQTARYRKGDVILYNDALYQSLKAKNQSAQPDVATTYWRKILGTGTGLDAGPDCSKPTLDANLIGCDYSADTSLKDKDLRGARLIDAKLAGDLGAVNLDGADLTGALFGISDQKDPPTGTGLVLKGGIGSYYIASFRGAKLNNTATPISQTPYDFSLHATGVDFSGANLNNIYWPGAKLDTSTMTHTSMVRAQFWDCICTMTNFAYADMRWAVLENAKLDTAVFYGANLTHASMTGVDLSGADLTGATLTGALLSVGQAATKLAGATLTGADLTGADFTGAVGGDSVIYAATTHFEATICPDGTKTDAAAVPTCQGHGFGAPQTPQ
ncbi:MAG: pentapeptide repeat-containing protein [Methylococcaceae bacterium]|nr:pentapeptide repeat-containing protein [Methylococcaceae bacterium]